MKKRIPAIILMFALFLTTSYAANTYRKTITVTSGVNVEFNNEAIDMTDANGKAVEAFIYNGTTYVPIRSIGELMDKNVNWDGTTNTATIAGARVTADATGTPDRNTQTISIYDDFSEVAAVAHGMSNILTGYSEAMFVGLAYVTGGEQESIQNMMDNMQTSNANMQSTLKYLSSDDGYNTCIGLLDDAVAKYNSAIASFNTAAQTYERYVQNGSDYYADAFDTEFTSAYNAYNDAQNAITDFFYDYAMWRDV